MKPVAPRRLNPLRMCWLLLLLAVTGCNQKELIRKFTPEAEDKFARQFLDHVITGKTDEAYAMLAPPLHTPQGRSGIEQLVAMFNGDTVKNIEVVGVYRYGSLTGSGAQQDIHLTYQVELAGGWFAGVIVVQLKNGARQITTARFNPQHSSLEQINGFTLAGKGLRHYLFLVLVTAVPLFILVTLVICARSKIRRKWAWILLVLIGLGTFRLNWSTGEYRFQILSFQLFGASAMKAGPAAPWIVGVSIPFGAVIFLVRRRELLLPKIDPPLPSTPPPLS